MAFGFKEKGCCRTEKGAERSTESSVKGKERKI